MSAMQTLKTVAGAAEPQLELSIDLPGRIGATLLTASGCEGINEIASYTLEVRLPDELDAHAIAQGLKNMEVSFGIDAGRGARMRRGLIQKAIVSRRVVDDDDDEGQTLQLLVSPRVANLARTRRHRTFAQSSVIEVTKTLFAAHQLGEPKVMHTGPSTQPPEHRLQISESDLNFLVRWWEHEGINYYIPADGEDRVVLFTSAVQLGARRHVLPLRKTYGGIEPAVRAINSTYGVVTAQTHVRDFDPAQPTTQIDGSAQAEGDRACGVAEYFGCGVAGRDDAVNAAQRLQTACEAEGLLLNGHGCLPDAAVGDILIPADGTPILLTHLRWHVSLRGTPVAECWFDGYPEGVELAPLHRAQRRPARGPAPGVVVDRKDPEKRGRVRVRFAWDAPDSAGVWCPVTQANDHWFRPRVGQIVEVNFALGDPDRPSVAGCSYSADDAPFDADDESEVSGIRTPHHEQIFDDDDAKPRARRHIGGDDENFIDGDAHSQVAGDALANIGGSQFLTVEGGLWQVIKDTFFVDAKKIVLRTPGGFIVIDESGVVINGPVVHIRKPGMQAPAAKKSAKKAPQPSKHRGRRKSNSSNQAQ